MRKILIIIILAGTLFSIGLWRLSDGFSIAKMSDPLPFDRRWEVANPSAFEVRKILNQPYTYIGKGSQSFVFESADHRYILKFFRLSRTRLPAFQRKLPLPPFLMEIQNRRLREKQVKRQELFASCKLAFEELREECGLIYLHLNKTTYLTQQVTLYDKLKRPHKVALDEFAFVIQKKGEMLFPYLGRLQGEELQKALRKVEALLDYRLFKNIADKDPEIHKNAGFCNGEAIFLDIGGFKKEPISVKPAPHRVNRVLAEYYSEPLQEASE